MVTLFQESDQGARGGPSNGETGGRRVERLLVFTKTALKFPNLVAAALALVLSLGALLVYFPAPTISVLLVGGLVFGVGRGIRTGALNASPRSLAIDFISGITDAVGDAQSELLLLLGAAFRQAGGSLNLGSSRLEPLGSQFVERHGGTVTGLRPEGWRRLCALLGARRLASDDEAGLPAMLGLLRGKSVTSEAEKPSVSAIRTAVRLLVKHRQYDGVVLRRGGGVEMGAAEAQTSVRPLGAIEKPRVGESDETLDDEERRPADDDALGRALLDQATAEALDVIARPQAAGLTLQDDEEGENLDDEEEEEESADEEGGYDGEASAVVAGQYSPADSHSALADLLRPTPGSMAMLIAAWDGLAVETQIAILAASGRASELPPHLRERLVLKASESPNEYVRYLAAKTGVGNAWAANDPSELVRCAASEGGWVFQPQMFFSGPEGRETSEGGVQEFFALPQAERLARVRGYEYGIIAALTEILKHVLDAPAAQAVPLQDLYEITLEALPVVASAFRNCDREFVNDGEPEGWCIDRELQHLWALLPRLPAPIQHALVKSLPEPQEDDVPREVFDWLTAPQIAGETTGGAKVRSSLLTRLLERSDIELKGFRRELLDKFLDGSCPPCEPAEAIFWHAEITYADFAVILREFGGRWEVRSAIADGGRVPLAILAAIEALELSLLDVTKSQSARRSLMRRLEGLHGEARRREMVELAICYLAGGDHPPDGAFAPIAAGRPTPRGDDEPSTSKTWATFLSYLKGYRKVRTRKLEARLLELAENRTPDPAWEWRPNEPPEAWPLRYGWAKQYGRR